MLEASSLFDFLAAEKNLAADSALLHALSGADEPTAYRIVRTLLQRKQRAGLRGLVEHYHELPSSIQERLLRQAKALSAALREASQTKSDQTLINMIDIIRQGGLFRSAYLLDLALRHREPHVRESAAVALVRLSEELHRTSPRLDGELSPASEQADEQALAERTRRLRDTQEDHRQIAAALDAALTSFHVHHHPRTVESAIWLVEDLDARFWAQMTSPGSKVARAAVSLVEGARDPRQIPFVILAMKYGSFRAPVARLFEDPLEPEYLNEWFRQGWRILQPKVKRGMAAIKDADCINEPELHLVPLSRDVQRHIPRWILSTGVPEDRKRVALRDLLLGAQPTGQRAALAALLQLKDDQSTSLLRRVAGQSGSDLAMSARLELARRQPDEYPPLILLEQLRGLGHADLNLAAPAAHQPPSQADRLTGVFNDFWTRFDTYSSGERAFRAKALFVKHPQCVEALRERLTEGNVHDRVRCLTIIAAAELAREFADELHQLSHDTDPGVRSTAIAALAPLKDPTSKHVVRSALSDSDTRVQANAVEAIGSSPDARELDELLLKLASPNNRVRANAVRTLLKLGVRDAAQTLLHMLKHESRAHRVSALWLVDQLGVQSIMNRIAQLAEADPDDSVRSRARAMFEKSPSSTAGEAQPAEVSP